MTATANKYRPCARWHTLLGWPSIYVCHPNRVASRGPMREAIRLAVEPFSRRLKIAHWLARPMGTLPDKKRQTAANAPPLTGLRATREWVSQPGISRLRRDHIWASDECGFDRVCRQRRTRRIDTQQTTVVIVGEVSMTAKTSPRCRTCRVRTPRRRWYLNEMILESADSIRPSVRR